MGWYSGNQFEEFLLVNRAFGPYGGCSGCSWCATSASSSCSGSSRFARAPLLLFVISLLINIGMWIERFVIVVGSLSRDYLPSAWGIFTPTFWDWSMLFGTLGLFGALDIPVRAPAASHSVVRDAALAARALASARRRLVAVIEPARWGLMAEFDSAEALLQATHRAYADGYRAMDAYSPFPVEGLAEALGSHHTRIPLIALAGGVIGATGGYAMQYLIHAVALPINIGGRPLNSWPAFVPVTFELSVLFAALFIAGGPAGAERLTAAIPSGLQRARVCAGVTRPLLSVCRGARRSLSNRSVLANFSVHWARGRCRMSQRRCAGHPGRRGGAYRGLVRKRWRNSPLIARSPAATSSPTGPRRDRCLRTPSRAAS